MGIQVGDFACQVLGKEEALRKYAHHGPFLDECVEELMSQVKGAELVASGRGEHNYSHWVYLVSPEGVAVKWWQALNVRATYFGDEDKIRLVRERVEKAYKQPGAISPWY